MSEKEEDKKLLAAIAQGDKKAYEALFRKYYAPMVLFADGMLKEKMESEDIVVDFFCDLWNKRTQLSQVENGKNYLFTLLRNRIIDTLRRKQRYRVEELQDSIPDISPEETMFEVELYVELDKAIESLPKKCAEVLRLKMDGFTDKEIAEKLGIQYETVRSHTKRGVLLIRKRFGKIYSITLFL